MRELGKQSQKENINEELEQIEGIMKEVTKKILRETRKRGSNKYFDED